MNTDLLEVFLPEGILEWFEVKKIQKGKVIQITFEEKNIVPKIPEEHRGKKIISKGFKSITVDDFPIRGRKAELTFLRRAWQIEGTSVLLKRDFKICAPGTKLEKEFGDFLKDFHRQFPDSSEPGGIMEPYTSEDSRKAIQESSE